MNIVPHYDLSKLCGNTVVYKEILKWIVDKLNNKRNKISIDDCIFISGNSGIGKTHSIKYICEEILDLYMIYITSFNCTSADELKDLLIKNTSSSMLQLLTNNTKKKIIVIDEIETIMSLDRTINTTLLNILTEEKLKQIPIICICSPDIIKKMGAIKKKCKIFELKIPNDDDIFNLINDINITNNIITDDNNIELKKRISNANGNISQTFNQLDNSIIDDVCKIDYLYGNKFNREYMRRIINIDSWLIPLRFHENLIKELKNRKTSIIINNNFYKNFMINICFFDILMNNNIDIAIDYFISMNYFLIEKPIKKRTISNIDNFTKILSYLSLQKKYNKRSYSTVFPLYQIGNYHINTLGKDFPLCNI